jgi:hypothetical protein
MMGIVFSGVSPWEKVDNHWNEQKSCALYVWELELFDEAKT